MKLSNRAAALAILLLSVVCCLLFVSNCTRGNKIDRLEQNEDAKLLREKLQKSDVIVVQYKKHIDSLYLIRAELRNQLDSINHRNEQRMALLQSYEQLIFQLKQKINEKRNLSDSSISVINSILPN